MAEKRTTYKLQDVGGIGEVKIADEVVLLSQDLRPQKLRVSLPWKEISPMNW